MTPQAYDVLNRAWKSTCRVVLGAEVGELEEYKGWLGEYLPPVGKRKSYISGREVTLANPRYPDDARFVSMEEIREKKADPLGINDIKDMDSVVRAVSEQWEYAGNRVQGNSAMVEASDIVVDSQSVSGSTDIAQSQYVFSSFMVRGGSKYIFGSGWFSKTEFAIRHVSGFNNARILDSSLVTDSSDIYYCHNMAGCMDAMFSFSQRNSRHCIGNLVLPKDKYLPLKSKLLSEIREELKAKKRFPSLMDMVADKGTAGGTLELPERNEKTDIVPVEKAFSSLFRILFAKEPAGMGPCENWLLRNIPPIQEVESPFGRRTFVPADESFACFYRFPRNRIVTLYEALELGKLRLNERDMASLGKIQENLKEIAFFTAELVGGNSSNAMKSPVVYNSSNIYKVYDATYSEYASMGSLSLNSKYAFGCYRIIDSEFCLKCNNSLRLSRCFEMDSSSNCLDSMFCHNSEALSDCMFCFNAKAKRHAIGNAQLAPEQYRRIKGILLAQIVEELDKNKSLKWDIFNVGCGTRKKG